MGDIPASIGEPLWPLSRFLGYRPAHIENEASSDDPERRGRLLPRWIHDNPDSKLHKPSKILAYKREHPWAQKAAMICLTFLGSFFSVALIATMSRSHPFLSRNAPIVIGSFGAEATLLYAAHTAPLSQPPNIIFGNTISAIIGVALAKGFVKIPGFVIGQIGNANWAVASLAISISIAVMQALNITHPPGGATAVLAVTIPAVYNLSWFYVADIVASSFIMLAWAMLINNLGHRKYPAHWISPALAKKVQARNPPSKEGKENGGS